MEVLSSSIFTSILWTRTMGCSAGLIPRVGRIFSKCIRLVPTWHHEEFKSNWLKNPTVTGNLNMLITCHPLTCWMIIDHSPHLQTSEYKGRCLLADPGPQCSVALIIIIIIMIFINKYIYQVLLNSVINRTLSAGQFSWCMISYCQCTRQGKKLSILINFIISDFYLIR